MSAKDAVKKAFRFVRGKAKAFAKKVSQFWGHIRKTHEEICREVEESERRFQKAMGRFAEKAFPIFVASFVSLVALLFIFVLLFVSPWPFLIRVFGCLFVIGLAIHLYIIWTKPDPWPIPTLPPIPDRQYEAGAKFEISPDVGDGDLPFCGYYFTTSDWKTGGCIIGVSGSGKSSLVKELIEAAGDCDDVSRLLVFDQKGDLRPFVERAARGNVILLHPYDLNGYEWLLAEEIDDVGDIYQIAHHLIPDQPDGFWVAQARILVNYLIQLLHHFAPGKWRLRHLVGLLIDVELAKAVLMLLPTTRAYALNELKGRLGRDISASARAWTLQLEIIAAAWEHARYGFTIKDFLVEDRSLVLGWDDKVSAALGGIYNLFINVFADQALSRQTTDDFTFAIFDEFAALPRNEAYTRLTSRGRSSSVGVLLTTLSEEMARSRHGPEFTGALLSTLNIQVGLRLASPKTATYFKELIGEWRFIEPTWGGPHGSTFTRKTEPLIMASEFTSLPIPHPENHPWIEGIIASPSSGIRRFRKRLVTTRDDYDEDEFPDFSPFERFSPPPPKQKKPPLGVRQKPENLLMTPFNEDDIEDLGIPATDELIEIFAKRREAEEKKGNGTTTQQKKTARKKKGAKNHDSKRRNGESSSREAPEYRVDRLLASEEGDD
jgi:hypothetical protein